MAESPLKTLAIDAARDALAAGNADAAWEWLETLDRRNRPPALVAACLDRRSLAAADRGDWNLAMKLAAGALAAMSTSWRQERVGLLRRRQPLLGDREWSVIHAKVPPAKRLTADALAPEIDLVAACGAYYSRGAGSGGPWAKYLRLSKQPPMDDEERQAIFRLAAGYFARFVLEYTSLLALAEVVVPVPANPNRYAGRMASLPDELTRGVESMLALPSAPYAVAWRPESLDVEMKHLHWSERRRLAAEAFTVGEHAAKVEGHVALLVDDVTTSGSTLRACARVLRDVGAVTVVACCLAHTEG